MLIDWTTVIFQIVNFLILLFLLRRFLYGPIIKAMDEREKKIAERFAEAERFEKEAFERASRLAAEEERLAENKDRLHKEARLEIDNWKEESLYRLQEEIAGQRKTWQKSLDEEQKTFLSKLKIQISRLVFNVSGKALADLADDRLEARLVDTFIEKIVKDPGLKVDEAESHEGLRVLSGFPLGEREREKLREGLKELFPDYRKFQFQEEPELGVGIRLIVGDEKWEWNLSRYMRDIENEIIKTIGVATGKKDE